MNSRHSLQVKSPASQREIGRTVILGVLLSDDVLDVECAIDGVLRESAVFAAIAGSKPNELALSVIH